MKKMFIALLFVVSTVFSVSAKTVAIQLECGDYVMTDDSCFPEYGDLQNFWQEMSDIMC